MSIAKVREHRSDSETPREQKLLLPGEWEQIQAQKDASRFLVPAGTDWVEKDVLGIANEVATRWPNLAVASCSCGHCLPRGHYPHVVLEYCKDGATRPVFGFTRFDRDVIHRLQAIHTSEDPQAKHEKIKEKARSDAKKQRADEQREKLEVVEAALRSPKINWTGPGGAKTNPHGRL